VTAGGSGKMAKSMDTQSHTEDSLLMRDMSVCHTLKITPTVRDSISISQIAFSV